MIGTRNCCFCLREPGLSNLAEQEIKDTCFPRIFSQMVEDFFSATYAGQSIEDVCRPERKLEERRMQHIDDAADGIGNIIFKTC